MKSLRLDPELAERLERAAAATGETLSQFIRTAAAARADAILADRAETDWSDVIGVVHGGGGRARRSGTAFTELLANDKRSA
ncbi:MAG: YlcI/YnfO family protein [Actinomycetota bacterium]